MLGLFIFFDKYHFYWISGKKKGDSKEPPFFIAGIND